MNTRPASGGKEDARLDWQGGLLLWSKPMALAWPEA